MEPVWAKALLEATTSRKLGRKHRGVGRILISLLPDTEGEGADRGGRIVRRPPTKKPRLRVPEARPNFSKNPA
jgi:hypothetical protein